MSASLHPPHSMVLPLLLALSGMLGHCVLVRLTQVLVLALLAALVAIVSFFPPLDCGTPSLLF